VRFLSLFFVLMLLISGLAEEKPTLMTPGKFKKEGWCRALIKATVDEAFLM